MAGIRVGGVLRTFIWYLKAVGLIDRAMVYLNSVETSNNA